VYAIIRLRAARNAWYWGVHFSRRGKLHYKRFYDLKHGSSKKALAAAVAWRDRELARAKALTYREFHQRRRSNNKSGIAGVHFLRPARQPRGIWQAKITLPDGTSMTRAFSMRKFGSREAFKRAAAARARMLTLVGERPYLHHPTAKRFAVQRARRTAGDFLDRRAPQNP
jgi:hypothetical protein